MERTLVLLKPDCVQRRLIGRIMTRLEDKGLNLVAIKMIQVTPDLARQHYAEHVDKPFYGDLVEFIGRSPSMIMVVEGPEDTWQVARLMIGATNPREAAPGTIRGDLGIDKTENLVHGSDSIEAAEREIQIFFPS